MSQPRPLGSPLKMKDLVNGARPAPAKLGQIPKSILDDADDYCTVVEIT